MTRRERNRPRPTLSFLYAPRRPLRFSSPRLEKAFFRRGRGVVVVHFLSEPCFGTEARDGREVIQELAALRAGAFRMWVSSR